MTDIKSLTLTQARDAMATKQADLGKVFAEATVTGDSGAKQYDFNKVTCLGADVKGSIAVAEKVKQMDTELNELGAHIDTLDAAEKAAASHADREKAVRRPHMPGTKGGPGFGLDGSRFKSLGDRMAEEKGIELLVKSGFKGGHMLSFDDVYMSDMFAAASAFETIGAKTLMTSAAGFDPETYRLPGFVEAATRPIQLLDIIPVFRTSLDTLRYMVETTRTHAAAERAEGGTFAESAFAFTESSSPVVKITDSVPVTDEQLEDVAFLSSYINSRLNFGVRQRLDGQIYVGDGNAPNMRGIKNTVGIQTQARGTDPIPDAFYKAMTKVRVTGRAVPTHHIIHPTDWQTVRLMRTADGVYIWGSPSEAGPERLWGLQVVQSDADSAGSGVTGSFQPAWLGLHERRGVDIQVGFTGDQFAQGKRTVRADMRAGLVVGRPAAFASVTGLS